MSRIWMAALLPLLLIACLPEQPPEKVAEPVTQEPVAPLTALPNTMPQDDTDVSIEEADPEELLDELLEMAQEPEKHELTPRPYAICDRLIEEGPTILAPFVALIDSEEASGATRLFVLRCLVGIMREDYLPQLEAMLDSEDWSTRSCAVTIIGSIENEASVEILKRVYEDDDEDERVSFSALSGLALQAGDPYRAELADLYFKEETSEEWKNEIVRVLLINPQPSDREILEDVLLAETTQPQGRDIAVMVLANIGSPESLPVLEESLTLDTRESFQNMAKSAIAFIRERTEAGQESGEAPEE